MSLLTPIFSFNKRLFTDVAMTANRESEVVDISEVTGFCVHSYWTGTPAGNIVVQGSNDGINFTTVDTQAAGGAAGSKLVNVAGAHYRYVKVIYTFTSSTGVLNCYISGKQG